MMYVCVLSGNLTELRMEEEHLLKEDSNQLFTTGNYSISTCPVCTLFKIFREVVVSHQSRRSKKSPNPKPLVVPTAVQTMEYITVYKTMVICTGPTYKVVQDFMKSSKGSGWLPRADLTKKSVTSHGQTLEETLVPWTRRYR